MEIRVGDFIQCKYSTFQVCKIIEQDVYEQDGHIHYDIEFYDERKKYHHWESYFDGGCVLRQQALF